MTKELLAKIKKFEEKAGKSWIQEFENVKTEQDIIQRAKKIGVEVSMEEATEGLSLINGNLSEELTDEELVGVVAGRMAL